jgi:hypothetical protein
MIRVFGRRYRQVVRGWEASIRGPDRHADRRYVQLSYTSGLKLMKQYKLVRRSYGYVLHCRPTGFGRCDHHQGAGYCFGNCGAGVVVLPLLGSRWLQSRTLIIV